MRDVYKHIEEVSSFPDLGRYTIVPKKFIVTKVYEEGRNLRFKEGEQRELSGRLVTERFAGAGRVFFLPYSVRTKDSEIERFVEIKGYGQDGREICLWTHCDGDILFGMFYKNAKKEFDILQKTVSVGLKVPIPLFTGKILREEWLRSGLRVVENLSGTNEGWNLEVLAGDNEKLKRKISERMNGHFHNIEDFLSAFSQPYNAGVLGRAVISPFRLGDPAKKYELNEENINIAQQCGHTFIELLNLGFLHLSPGTGNWTEAGELTDMADCYDLKKDRNLRRIISERKQKTEQDFWESLIGPYHTSNLYSDFIRGMFGEEMPIEEAAKKLKAKTFEKIDELKN